MPISAEQLIVFGCVFMRILFLFVFAPGINSKEFIGFGKVSFTFWVTALIMFVIPLPTNLPETGLQLFFVFFQEALIGMILGFVMQLFILGIEFGGSLADTQAGLSVANVLDPAFGQNVTLISRLFKQLAILLFFILGGHHILLSGLVKSFDIIPITRGFNVVATMPYVLEVSVQIFSVALQIASPVILVIFFVDFGFGLLSKIAPQINVFQLSFQMKPMITMLILLFITAGMLDLLQFILENTTEMLLNTLIYMRS